MPRQDSTGGDLSHHQSVRSADEDESSAPSRQSTSTSTQLSSRATGPTLISAVTVVGSVSSPVSSFVSFGTLLLVLVVSLMVLPHAASAFRHSGGNHSHASGRHRSGGGGGGRMKRSILKSASKIHSFGYKAAERAAEAVERHKRTYWDEMVPPFGLDGPGGAGLDLEDLINTAHTSSGSSNSGRSKKKRRKGALYRSLKMKLSQKRREATALMDDVVDMGGIGESERLDPAARIRSDDDSHSTYDLDNEDDADTVTHFCFLVHGHRGLSKDLWYLESVLNDAAARRRREALEAEEGAAGAQKEGEVAGLKRSGSAYGSMENLDSGAITIESPEKADGEGQHAERKRKVRHDVLVHNVVCNEGRTHDGVVAGGERVAAEVLGVMRAEVERKRKRRQRLRRERGDEAGEGEYDHVIDVTISMVGNSLGGLYSRYAIAHIAQMAQPAVANASVASAFEKADESSLLIDDGAGGLFRLHYNSFYTTASPHLGTSRHTYLPLPLPLEIPIAKVLGDTGRDLFRQTPLLREMATSDKYLSPLAKFKTRVAYANAYHTDFPVPASTAAFLSEESDYPHHFAADGSEDDVDVDLDAEGRIIATLHVPPVSGVRRSKSEGNASNGAASVLGSFSNDESTAADERKKEEEEEEEARHKDELALMSSSLDSLGWKKVIVDLRSDMPLSLSMPDVSTATKAMLKKGSEILSLRKLRGESSSSSSSEGDEPPVRPMGDAAAEEDQPPVRPLGDSEEQEGPCPAVATGCPHTIRRARSSLSSREVATAFSSPRGSVHLPLGHNMIVAFSRTRFSALVNRGGRPVMDRLARELVEDMVSWGEDEEDKQTKEVTEEQKA